MTACVHLHRIVLQGVEAEGELALPAGCCLHVICDRKHPGDIHVCVDKVNHHDLVTELSLRCASCHWTLAFWPWDLSPHMQNLTLLRVNVLERISDGEMGEDFLMITMDSTPNLEVLELYMNCNMTVDIDSSVPLQSLLIVAVETLQLNETEDDGVPTLLSAFKRMYLQSGAPLEPSYKKALKDLNANVHWAGKRLLECIKEEPNSWSAAVPAVPAWQFARVLLRRMS